MKRFDWYGASANHFELKDLDLMEQVIKFSLVHITLLNKNYLDKQF